MTNVLRRKVRYEKKSSHEGEGVEHGASFHMRLQDQRALILHISHVAKEPNTNSMLGGKHADINS